MTESKSTNIIDAYSGNLYHNPFSSGFFLTVKNGIELNLVPEDLRLIQTFILLMKDFAEQPTKYIKATQWFRNPLLFKTLPLFLFNRYLRI